MSLVSQGAHDVTLGKHLHPRTGVGNGAADHVTPKRPRSENRQSAARCDFGVGFHGHRLIRGMSCSRNFAATLAAEIRDAAGNSSPPAAVLQGAPGKEE